MTRFKVCGLRDSDNAIVAARAGAEFLGFVFVPGVRRQLTIDQASEILNRYRSEMGDRGPRLVGLFADQPLEEVNAIVRSCELDLAQLCGDEPPQYWEQVEASIIRQIKVRQSESRQGTVEVVLRRIDEVVSRGYIPMLDAYEAGALGGTGRSFDWTIAAEAGIRHDIVLAGGLTPENVREAISTARPWGVDVSSGVETGGAKDPKKIVAFAEHVRLVDGGS